MVPERGTDHQVLWSVKSTDDKTRSRLNVETPGAGHRFGGLPLKG
jgi:hypothetical protein